MSKHTSPDSGQSRWPRRDLVLLSIGLIAIVLGVAVTALATRQGDVAVSEPAAVSAPEGGAEPFLVPDSAPRASAPLLASDSTVVLSGSSSQRSATKPVGPQPTQSDPNAAVPDWAWSWLPYWTP